MRCYHRALEDSENPKKHDLRPVMIHCQTARRDHYAAMRELGIIPSIFSSHIWHWGDVHLRNFGPERASRISACAWAKQEGLPFTLHNDTPIVPNDMMLSVWCAARRVTKVTKGTLEVGKLADMAVLDSNPLDVEIDAVRRIRLVRTIKEGKTVWER